MLQPGGCVGAPPHDPSGRVGGAGQLGQREDRVLGIHAILEQHLAAVHGVREFEGDGAQRLEPVDVREVSGFGAVLDHDEEVEVRVVVEPREVRADGPESEQCERIATIGQDPTQLVESGEQPAGHVAGHVRPPGSADLLASVRRLGAASSGRESTPTDRETAMGTSPSSRRDRSCGAAGRSGRSAGSRLRG